MKCYIDGDRAEELCGCSTGESFWIELLDENRAFVRNNLLCGLSIGDEIEIQENGPSGHPREFTKLIKRSGTLYFMSYKFNGIERAKETNKFPDKVQNFIHLLSAAEILFESVVCGLCAIKRPTQMDEDRFFRMINSGPIVFESKK